MRLLWKKSTVESWLELFSIQVLHIKKFQVSLLAKYQTNWTTTTRSTDWEYSSAQLNWRRKKCMQCTSINLRVWVSDRESLPPLLPQASSFNSSIYPNPTTIPYPIPVVIVQDQQYTRTLSFFKSFCQLTRMCHPSSKAN